MDIERELRDLFRALDREIERTAEEDAARVWAAIHRAEQAQTGSEMKQYTIQSEALTPALVAHIVGTTHGHTVTWEFGRDDDLVIFSLADDSRSPEIRVRYDLRQQFAWRDADGTPIQPDEIVDHVASGLQMAVADNLVRLAALLAAERQSITQRNKDSVARVEERWHALPYEVQRAIAARQPVLPGHPYIYTTGFVAGRWAASFSPGKVRWYQSRPDRRDWENNDRVHVNEDVSCLLTVLDAEVEHLVHQYLGA